MKKNLFSTSIDPYRIQKTLKSPVTFRGQGLHTGKPSEVKLIPAPPNSGIVFRKRINNKNISIPAHYQNVLSTCLATSLGLKEFPDSIISTVEHLLAALFGVGISNLEIWVNGPEIPILDGSALPFVEAVLECGLTPQSHTTKTLKILKPIKIYEKGAICELLPRKNLRLTTSIQFKHPMIGDQTFSMDLTPQNFHQMVGPARTFGFLAEVEHLRSSGLAQGASLENVLGFSPTGVINSEGMRFPDECVRHKWLDALGDLSLCGSFVEGELVSFRGGHAIHRSLLNALKKHKDHWQLIPSEQLGPIHPSDEISLTLGSSDCSISKAFP